MKNLKRNQIIIFVIALTLVSAGYLNYTANNINSNSTAVSANVNEVQEIASIGDAKLVSTNAVIETNSYETGLVSNEGLTENEAVTTSNKETDEYFTNSKLTRDTMYSQMIESYEKILANENINNEQKTIAQTEIKNINDVKNRIMICENLISTKGIKDSVIFVNGDSISVILRADKIEQNEIAQVQNIITREMKVNASNIHISNK